MKRAILIAALLVALAAGAGGFLWWYLTPTWPDFPADASGQPQAIVQVDRDYANHIGDLIEVRIFIRQPAGSVVSPDSLKVDGDFEQNGKVVVTEKEMPDGSKHYRAVANVQSFKAQPKLNFTASMLMTANGERAELKVQKDLFWSNTYDGVRKELQEGGDQRIPKYWYMGKFVAAIVVSSLVFLGMWVIAIRNFLRRPRPIKFVDPKPLRAAALLEKVKAGTCSRAEHLELDGLFRERWNITSIPASQLENRLLAPELVQFLLLNAPAIYAKEPPEQEENLQLAGLGARVLRNW